jgi:hypothetical protein
MKGLPIARRTLLRAAGAGSLGVALPRHPRGATAAGRPDTGVTVYPFPLTAVSLLPGPFRDNMTRTMACLSLVDADRLLHTFRLNLGLASSARPCGGWESPDTSCAGTAPDT